MKTVEVKAIDDMGHFILSPDVPVEVYNAVSPYYYTVYRPYTSNGKKYSTRHYICRQRAYPKLEIVHNGILYKIDNKWMKGDIVENLKAGYDVTLNKQSVIYDPEYDTPATVESKESVVSPILQKFWEFFGVH